MSDYRTFRYWLALHPGVVYEKKTSFQHGAHIAESVAIDFYEQHDGCKEEWPLEFIIEWPDGKQRRRFEVERETDPRFIPMEKL